MGRIKDVKIGEGITVAGYRVGVIDEAEEFGTWGIKKSWYGSSFCLSPDHRQDYGPFKELHIYPDVAIGDLIIGPHPLEHLRLPNRVDSLFLINEKIRLHSIDLPHFIKRLNCLNTIQVNGLWDKVNNGGLEEVNFIDPEQNPDRHEPNLQFEWERI